MPMSDYFQYLGLKNLSITMGKLRRCLPGWKKWKGLSRILYDHRIPIKLKEKISLNDHEINYAI